MKTAQDEIAKLNAANQNLAPTQNYDNDKIFGLIRKANGRINGLVKRIESLEDEMDEPQYDRNYSQSEEASAEEDSRREDTKGRQRPLEVALDNQDRSTNSLRLSEKDDSEEWEEAEDDEDEQEEEDEEERSNDECVQMMEKIQRETMAQTWNDGNYRYGT